VLHLIKMWLECAVEETDDRGRKKHTTEARDNGRGIPQGSPISPLLSNLYMRRFVLGWKKLGLEHSLGSRIVTYADDLVILCKRGKADEALQCGARKSCCPVVMIVAPYPSNRRDGSGRSIRRSDFGCLSGRFEVGPVCEGRMAPVSHRPSPACRLTPLGRNGRWNGRSTPTTAGHALRPHAGRSFPRLAGALAPAIAAAPVALVSHHQRPRQRCALLCHRCPPSSTWIPSWLTHQIRARRRQMSAYAGSAPSGRHAGRTQCGMCRSGEGSVCAARHTSQKQRREIPPLRTSPKTQASLPRYLTYRRRTRSNR
jgi:hypothetical protein